MADAEVELVLKVPVPETDDKVPERRKVLMSNKLPAFSVSAPFTVRLAAALFVPLVLELIRLPYVPATIVCPPDVAAYSMPKGHVIPEGMGVADVLNVFILPDPASAGSGPLKTFVPILSTPVDKIFNVPEIDNGAVGVLSPEPPMVRLE